MEVYIHRNGTDYGPYSSADVKAQLRNGTILPSDYAWYEGVSDWSRLSSIEEFADIEAAPIPAAVMQTQRILLPDFPTPQPLGPYATETIQRNESALYRTKIHSIVLVRGVIAAATISLFVLPVAIGGAMANSAVWLFLLFIPVMLVLPGLIVVKTSELLITNRRVVIKVGFLHRRTLEIFVTKIESVAVDQPLFGRMFGYGTVTIRGTGGSAESFRTIASPIEFRNWIQRAQSESESR